MPGSVLPERLRQRKRYNRPAFQKIEETGGTRRSSVFHSVIETMDVVPFEGRPLVHDCVNESTV